MQLWDSWSGNNSSTHTGTCDYGPFTTGDSLELMLSGYPNTSGISLKLVSGSDTLALRAVSDLSVYWTRVRWDLPREWQHRSCHIVAQDNAAEKGGDWIGFSSPLTPSGQYLRSISESGLQLALFFLLLVPGFAILLFFPKADALQALLIVLLATAGLAYAAFFAYFFSPALGRTFSYVIYGGALAALIAKRRETLSRIAEPRFVFPLLLAAAVSVFYFASTFLYGGIESPEEVSLSRFLPWMPTDPLLPYWFARTLAKGEPLHPFVNDWLTSDRPPLQAGFYLLLWPFSPTRYDYQVVGIAAQSWVWIGLWCFLQQMKIGVRSTVCVFAVAIFSGFFLFNSAYCWPKFLPTAFLLLATGLLWGGKDSDSPDMSTSLVNGACAAFAMLGHGGSIFGLAGIGLVYVIEKRKIPLRLLGFGLGALVLVMLPWTLYQKLVDPPGDRLIKYHLADHPAIDPRPSLSVIREAYAKLSWQEVAGNKLSNFRTLVTNEVGRPWAAVRDFTKNAVSGTATAASLEHLKGELRASQFRHYFQAPGLFLLGLLGLCWCRLKRRVSPETVTASLALRLFNASCIVWCLLMFAPNSTCIHQGSYFTGACLFIATGLGMALLPRALSLTLLFAGTAAFYWLWVKGIARPDPQFAAPATVPGFSLVVFISSACVIGLLIFAVRNADAFNSGAADSTRSQTAKGA
jgi:hypothetical protein